MGSEKGVNIWIDVQGILVHSCRDGVITPVYWKLTYVLVILHVLRLENRKLVIIMQRFIAQITVIVIVTFSNVFILPRPQVGTFNSSITSKTCSVTKCICSAVSVLYERLNSIHCNHYYMKK